MAGYKRYRKDSPVSYALGITLTFELLRFQPDKVTRVYIHSGMKEGETLDHAERLRIWFESDGDHTSGSGCL